MSDTEDRLRAIIVQVMGKPAEEVMSSSSIDDTDSLDQIQIIMAAEEEFGIEIHDDRALAIRTFGDLAKLVHELLATRDERQADGR